MTATWRSQLQDQEVKDKGIPWPGPEKVMGPHQALWPLPPHSISGSYIQLRRITFKDPNISLSAEAKKETSQEVGQLCAAFPGCKLFAS